MLSLDILRKKGYLKLLKLLKSEIRSRDINTEFIEINGVFKDTINNCTQTNSIS